MSEATYDVESLLNDMDSMIDNWDAAKEVASQERGPTEFRNVSEGEHVAQFKGELGAGRDKNGVPYLKVPFVVQGGEDDGLTDSFFFSFKEGSTNEQGVMWGEVNLLQMITGLGMDLGHLTSRREAMEVVKGLVAGEIMFNLFVKKNKNGFLNKYTRGIIEQAQESPAPVKGQEVAYKLGTLEGKGIYQKDNGDGTHAVKVGNKLHNKVTLVA